MASFCSKVIRPNPLISIVSVFLFAMLLVFPGCGSHKNYETDPELTGYSESGKASYYSMKYQFRKTASGERFNNYAMTAAHKTLPFGTDVLVKNLDNDKKVTVTINDRGPFVEGRIIDLSRAAFAKIASIDQGVTEVKIKVVN